MSRKEPVPAAEATGHEWTRKRAETLSVPALYRSARINRSGPCPPGQKLCRMPVEVDGLVAHTLFGAVAHRERRAVPVADVGDGGIDAGALGQVVLVAQCELFGVTILRALVVMEDVAGEHDALAHRGRHAQQQVGRIGVRAHWLSRVLSYSACTLATPRL